MEIVVEVPGSCGELVQGISSGVPFLVTCPVNLYTTVRITDKNRERSGLGAKSKAAFERTLEYLGQREFPYGISLSSELPIGKGMASSSADIAAVCVAVATALEKPLTAAEISRLAAGIEPTDGIFFHGIVRMNHMTGECLERLGTFPALSIAVFDTGGTVDTLAFHEREDLEDLAAQNEAIVAQALDFLREPLDAAAVAEAATRSALANQTILPKQGLSEILCFARAEGALGINVAHSGTILGVLFAPEVRKPAVSEAAGRIARKFRHLQYLQNVELISGGYKVERVD